MLGRLLDRAGQHPAAAPALLTVAATASMLFLLLLGERHFEQWVQMAAGWGALATLFVLCRMRRFQRMPWRIVFFLLGGFVAMRYLWWRTSETLVFTGPFDFLGMALLYLVEVYAIIVYFLGMFVNLWPLTTESIALPEDRDSWPTVDVYIPTYNEPEELVRVTVIAATQIDYPRDKLNVYVLDDGGTLARRNDPDRGAAAWERRYALMRLARELGAGYLTRETNASAKAGNLNHALGQTKGELILFLDCDHVPTKDILLNTAGHFVADPRLFLVQMPHFFINPAPVDKNASSRGAVPDEGDIFYRVIHRGLNFWNASYFCGSAALMRRSCLEEVGGVSGDTITEDAETAFALHCRGYNSVYIRRPMVCGLSPESYDGYIMQRTRWAQGMVQLFIINNPLFARGLSFAQRLCYFNSCFFWFFSLARVVYYFAPSAFLIFGLSIYHASSGQVLAYAVPHVLATFVVMHFLYSAARQPFFSEIYESVQSLSLLPAVLRTIADPRAPSFKVTPKELKLGSEVLNPMAVTFYLVVGVNLLALGLGCVKWSQYPTYRDILAVTMSWSAYNLYLGLVTMGAFWERRQVRLHHRIQARGPVAIRIERTGELLTGEMNDISLTGVGVEFFASGRIHNMDRVELRTRDSYGNVHQIPGTVQRVHQAGERCACGVEFLVTKMNYAQIVSFVYGDSGRWVELWGERAQYGGTLRLMWVLLGMGVKAFLQTTLSFLAGAAASAWRWIAAGLFAPAPARADPRGGESK
ncbi:MAG: cellulose synthase catalytic subunit (UDP-forming) [Betaproteobacteria bacterium RIFCSPLOWO2_12_FULL_64_23]|nr:MAG: cellulose synthase catalytic subunit (UDP-forming) [Betaproteobacteria bacterium RIFCSPLOWO2_12_FULL_64_23]